MRYHPGMPNTEGVVADDDPQGASPSGPDRRSLIKAGAAVGVGAWVAPQVFSATAAAAASVCVGVATPHKIAGPTSTPPLGGFIIGSAQLCFTQGSHLIAATSGGGTLQVDDFLVIRVTRPDASLSSLVVGSYWNNWDINTCPGLIAWANANVAPYVAQNPTDGAGSSPAIDITGLLQSSPSLPNKIDVFVYNCGGNGGTGTDVWLV